MYRINYDLISKSQLRTGKLYLHNIKIINKFRRTISYLHFDLGGDVTCKINTALENFTSKILTWLFKRSKYMYIPCGFFLWDSYTLQVWPPPPPNPPTQQYFNKSFFLIGIERQIIPITINSTSKAWSSWLKKWRRRG